MAPFHLPRVVTQATAAAIAGSMLFGGSASAQSSASNERWRWVHFTTESGLPSDRVPM